MRTALELVSTRIVVLLAALLAACAVALMVSPARSTAHPCIKGNELWFRAADGAKLVGHRFGGQKPGARTAVVLAHMSAGDLCQWVPYARGLARQGFFVFPFDFRGHGFSEGRENHGRSAADVAAAVRAVRKLGARKVIVVGASLGAIAALVAAPNLRPAVDGIVSVSAPATIAGQLNALPTVPRIRVPTLYLAAKQDQSSPYDFAADAQTLFDATGTDAKRLEVLPGSLHGVFLVSGSASVRSLLLAFARDPSGTVRS
jgi:alpha-beta hydrolase superfamily lysophospholipase